MVSSMPGRGFKMVAFGGMAETRPVMKPGVRAASPLPLMARTTVGKALSSASVLISV